MRRANQWGRALAAAGADSSVRLSHWGFPTPSSLVLAALGCWKIGAVPVPMRWDLPEWERSRVLEVIAPAVTVDDHTSSELTANAADQSADPLPDVVSPNANGICSSGSTGLPKVILTLAQGTWTPESSFPFLAAWAPTAQPQTILVPGADVSHQRVLAAHLPAGRRPAGGARKVRRGNGCRCRSSATASRTSPPRRQCWPASRRCPTSASGTCPASRGSCRAPR